MRKMKVIRNVVAVLVISILLVSCSKKALIHTATGLPIVMPTNEPTMQETWGSYLYGILKNRQINSLYKQQDSEINLIEYIEQGKITIEEDSSEIDLIKDSNVSSYLLDMDKDGVDELYLIQSEGSIRQYYGKVFKKKNETYLAVNTFEGHILPVRYNNEVHFISIENDFETKFTNAVTEYEVNDLAFKPIEILNIDYVYDLSKVSKPIRKMINNEYLNSLNKYEISNSNIANITKTTEQPAYDVQLADEKNKNTFNFGVKLWYTSVGYAPNYWEISSKDENTHHFKGMEQIETNEDKGTDKTVLYGLKFYQDESDQIFLLKVSYPFFTMEPRRDGNLILQLFKFNKSSVEEVEKVLVEPRVEVITEKSSTK